MGRGLLAALLLGAAGDVRAHAFSPDAGHFYNGLLHAFIDPAQILLLLALALLAAQRDLIMARTVALGVPLTALLASLLPVAPQWLGLAEAWVLCGAMVAAMAVAWAGPLPRWLLQVAVLLAACGPGLVNAAELAQEPWLIPRLYLSGAAMGIGFLLLSLFVALVQCQRWLPSLTPMAMRVLASWSIAAAAMLLALRWA